MSVPTREIQTLEPGAELEFFVLDATALGGGVTRFHGGTNNVGTAIVWQGNTYTPMPIEATGFETTSKGVIPRPMMRVANLNGVVASLVRTYGDLVGATVTRKRTLRKFLDAVNFGGYNPTADSTAAFADDVFKVERKSYESRDFIEFELSASSDMHGATIPRRLVQATICPWAYKGTECGYSGSLPTCLKTLADCTAHWSCSSGSISISAVAGTPSKYNRASGSWITDGFVVGQIVIAQGFTNSANNGLSYVSAVTATDLSVMNAQTPAVGRFLVNEAAGAGRVITSDAQLPFGGFPGAGLIR